MSHAALVATTELEAINVMLFTIGEQPVSSLEESGLADVAIAKVILSEQNRRFQTKGWDFNTDLDYALAVNIDSKIVVPTNAMRIDPSRGANAVARAGFMWDRTNNAWTWENTMYCDIVRYLSYESMPESARHYVTLKAARVFQKRIQGDDALEAFTEKDEFEAKADFHDSEQSSADRNMLNTPEIAGMTRVGRDQRNAYNW